MRDIILGFMIAGLGVSIGCADIGPGADDGDADTDTATGSGTGPITPTSLPPTQTGASASATGSPTDDTSDATGGAASTSTGPRDGTTAETDTAAESGSESSGAESSGAESSGSEGSSSSTGDPCGNGVLDPGEDCDEDAFARDACSIDDAPLECDDACQVVEASCCAPAGTVCVVGLNQCCNGCDGIVGQCS